MKNHSSEFQCRLQPDYMTTITSYFLEITGKGFFERKNTLTVITNGSKGVFAKITACCQGAWG
jgi:hypothetical protein